MENELERGTINFLMLCHCDRIADAFKNAEPNLIGTRQRRTHSNVADCHQLPDLYIYILYVCVFPHTRIVCSTYRGSRRLT